MVDTINSISARPDADPIFDDVSIVRTAKTMTSPLSDVMTNGDDV